VLLVAGQLQLLDLLLLLLPLPPLLHLQLQLLLLLRPQLLVAVPLALLPVLPPHSLRAMRA
jgi:hypothetical protein